MAGGKPKDGCFYEIKIEGHLDRTRFTGFEDLRVNLLPEGQTRISGRFVDQAALFGILIRIRDMGVSLISVTRFDQGES